MGRKTGYLKPTMVKMALLAEPMLTLQSIHVSTQTTVINIDARAASVAADDDAEAEASARCVATVEGGGGATDAARPAPAGSGRTALDIASGDERDAVAQHVLVLQMNLYRYDWRIFIES